MKAPVRVAVTGAAGQIGYSLLFRIAAGDMLGPDQPVILHLAEVGLGMRGLEGVVMELEDCTFPLLAGVECTDDPEVAFADVDVALLVGASPRRAGMERSELLSLNGAIFKPQGQALGRNARKHVKVVVVGNPANTNALVALSNASGLDPRQFTALTRLDHNRAVSQLAARLGAPVAAIRQMAVWGNHSSTQYPDLHHCLVDGRPAMDLVADPGWYEKTFIPTVAKRGAAIIDARGLSSAASAANAAIDHIHDWVHGTPEGDWVSMAVWSDGSYGVPEGLVYSFPCVCRDGAWSIVQGLEINPFSQARMDATTRELEEERRAVLELGLIEKA